MRYAVAARVTWGVSLLLAPGTVIRVVSREPVDRVSGRVGRVLGLRHLAQALTIERGGTRNWILAGASIDAAHALSMVGVATIGGKYGRLAALDAAIAGGWAVSGLWEARSD
jgi:hypothetical protein